MPIINIISPDNGFGNTIDIRIVREVLESSGYEVHISGIPHYGMKRRLYIVGSGILKNRGRFDLNLFLGPVLSEWFPFAKRNAIIPNAEWFLRKWIPLLPKFSLVLAKTRLTERLFKEEGCATKFVSFTSEDHSINENDKSYGLFLHTSSNPFKGTLRLLETWERHPEWPTLTAVVNRSSPTTNAENINLMTEYLPDEELLRLQNSHGVHICCSEAEGFGHYLAEAMSTRALTVTTNAPPMNELVTEDRGILVDYDDEREENFSKFYRFSSKSLEQRIEEIINEDDETKQKKGERARQWYEENDLFFRSAFPEAIETALRR